jgi:hypothetical protein
VLIASESYLSAVENIANERFSTNQMRLKKLERVIDEALKQFEFSTNAGVEVPGGGGWVTSNTVVARSVSGGGSGKVVPKVHSRSSRRREKKAAANGDNGGGDQVYRGKKWLRKQENKQMRQVQLGPNDEGQGGGGGFAASSSSCTTVWGASCTLVGVQQTNTTTTKSSESNLLLFGGYGLEIDQNKKVNKGGGLNSLYICVVFFVNSIRI